MSLDALDITIILAIGKYNRRNRALTPDEIRASFKRLEARLTAEEAAKKKDAS